MTIPSVAVLIPAYNHSAYIEETLESVFRQTLPPQEVIVIDDGSTDDTVAVIKRVFAGQRSIRCLLHARENRGISATRNELWAAASTDVVAFLDSDDLYAPTRLERMLAEAPVTGLYFAFSGVNFRCERDDESRREWHELYHDLLGQGTAFPTAGFAVLRSNVAISASNFVVSRELLGMVGGFDDRIKICQDWDLAVQALRFVEPTFIPEPLLTYRVHATNTSRDSRGTSAQEADVVVDNLKRWISAATPNARAPTPLNWPRYFRLFAHLNQTRAGQTLAASLPRECVMPSRVETTAAGETRAIRDLIDAARGRALIHDLSDGELMLRCHQQWSRIA
jgi:glycosyltransferase involved in cell wall biosynthesis